MADVDPFESMRSLAELWGKSGNAFLQSRRACSATWRIDAQPPRAERRRRKRQPLPVSRRRDALGELWSSSTELSASLAKAMQGGQASDPIVAEMLGKIFDPKSWMSGTSDSTRRCRRWPRARGF